jgi:hypothetical protein
MPEHSQEHLPNNSHSLRGLLILLGILAGMVILVFRPFGYRMFQIGVGEHNVFAIILVFGIVGVILVILQQIGIIFADSSKVKK